MLYYHIADHPIIGFQKLNSILFSPLQENVKDFLPQFPKVSGVSVSLNSKNYGTWPHKTFKFTTIRSKHWVLGETSWIEIIKLTISYSFSYVLLIIAVIIVEDLIIINNSMKAYPCKFAIRDHARNAGPPKKSSKLEVLILKFCLHVHDHSWKY